MDLEIRHLTLVAAIAEHGTLTRAGDVLHLSQSALSHQLRDLEERVGTRLFVRGKLLMTITAAGEKLLQAARSILATLNGTSYALRSGDLAGPVPLRIATECNTCYHWLPAVLPAFRKKFPHVEIRHVQLTEAVLGLVKADVGVAILAKWVLQNDLDAGTVRGIRITAKGYHRRWQAVVPKRLAGKDYITDFCRLLVSHAPKRSEPASPEPWRRRALKLRTG